MMENEEIKQYLINFAENTLNECEAFTKVYGKDFVRKRLDINLDKVYVTYIDGDSNKVNTAYYDLNNHCITIFLNTQSAKPLQKDDIEKNKKLKQLLLHEIVHAIFMRTKEECKTLGIDSGTGVLEFYDDGTDIGRGLNEGLTQWICQKAGYGTIAYITEMKIIKMLELAIGEESVMKLANGDIRGNIAQLLQMTEEECIHNLALVDNIYQNEKRVVSENRTIENNEDEILDKSISHFEAGIFEKYFRDEIEEAQNTKNISEKTMQRLWDLYFSINGGKTSGSAIFNNRLPLKFKREIYPELMRKHQEDSIKQIQQDRLKKLEKEKTNLPVVYKKNLFQRLKEAIKKRFIKTFGQEMIQENIYDTLPNEEKKTKQQVFREYTSDMSNYSKKLVEHPKITTTEQPEENRDKENDEYDL